MNEYQIKLKCKMNQLAHEAYRLSRKLPTEELYGITSQVRRANLSIILNYIEGYARRKDKIKLNFWEISYGSLQETKYLLEFAEEEGYFCIADNKQLLVLAEEVGAMLWKEVKHLDSLIY